MKKIKEFLSSISDSRFGKKNCKDAKVEVRILGLFLLESAKMDLGLNFTFQFEKSQISPSPW